MAASPVGSLMAAVEDVVCEAAALIEMIDEYDDMLTAIGVCEAVWAAILVFIDGGGSVMICKAEVV